MAQSPNSIAVPTVTMDSRKFLSALNDSAQAKVAFFEERIAQMGKEAQKHWRLAALHAKNLYIEDTDTNTYYVADHARNHGKITILNIRPIQIVEGEKHELFHESALRLVNALESNNQTEMASAFNRLKAQRFSSRVVPCSGIVRCRDGVQRHINISNGDTLGEDVRDRLVACLVEALRDRVVVEGGHVVAGYFGTDEIKLPVTKWGARKLVARRMLEAAEKAYLSSGFQTRIYALAKLISEGKIEEAVQNITNFLDSKEEFTLLTRAKTQTLVENALAAKAIFNQQLCDDTATLFYRTNMRISRAKIIDEWKHIARKAEHPVLAENISVLENSANFETTYDKFLKLIFEAISNREVAAEALATTLNVLRDKTPKIKESHELSSKLNGLINRLKQRDFDDAAIYEAEDLIATIQEELGAAETLSNFDQMPGDTPGMDPMEIPGAETGGAGGAPVININSPLIQIGGTSAAAGGEAPPEPGAEAEEEGDPELEALLGGGGAPPPAAPPPAAPPPAAPPPAAPPLTQSRDRHGNLVAEGIQLPGYGNPADKPYRDDHPSEFEGFEKYNDETDEWEQDPYAVTEDEKVNTEGLRFTDYGAPVITDEGALDRIVRIMTRLATEHKLVGKSLSENLENMAKASIKAMGIRIPEGRLPKALEQVISAFTEEWEKPWLKKNKKKKGDEEDEDETEVTEDQYKLPLIKPRGFARSNLDNEAGKLGRSGGKGGGGPKPLSEPTSDSESEPASESRNLRRAIAEGIVWGESQTDAIQGELAGVKFIFDHGGDSELKPIILSEDGAVEIPIPPELYDDAFAAAQMVEGDGTRFVAWVAESLEQLRPISTEEDRALEEAVAKISTGPDGSLSVEVTPDVEVGEVDGGEAGMETGTDEGMAPVDATAAEPTPTGGGGPDGLDAGAEPDFEAQGGEMGGEMGGGEMGGGEMGGGEMGGTAKPVGGGGGGMNKPMGQRKPVAKPNAHFEDRDVTAPPSSKYTSHVKDNKRQVPKSKMPGKASDTLADIGPELKVDDGSGTKPPTAKKGSDE